MGRPNNWVLIPDSIQIAYFTVYTWFDSLEYKQNGFMGKTLLLAAMPQHCFPNAKFVQNITLDNQFIPLWVIFPYPWALWGFGNRLDPLALSQGCKYVLVMLCMYSYFIEAFPCPQPSVKCFQKGFFQLGEFLMSSTATGEPMKANFTIDTWDLADITFPLDLFSFLWPYRMDTWGEQNSIGKAHCIFSSIQN